MDWTVVKLFYHSLFIIKWVLFQNESYLNNPWSTLDKFFTGMFGMAAGGFDLFESIQENTNSFSTLLSDILLFLLFFFLVFLVQMNLMTGIAVADVKVCLMVLWSQYTLVEGAIFRDWLKSECGITFSTYFFYHKLLFCLFH